MAAQYLATAVIHFFYMGGYNSQGSIPISEFDSL